MTGEGAILSLICLGGFALFVVVILLRLLFGGKQPPGSGYAAAGDSGGRYDPYVPEEHTRRTLTADEVLYHKSVDARIGITDRRYAETYLGEYLPVTDAQYRRLYEIKAVHDKYTNDPNVVDGECEWEEEEK